MRCLLFTLAVLLVSGIKCVPLTAYEQVYLQNNDEDNKIHPSENPLRDLVKMHQPERPPHNFVKNVINKQNLYQNAFVDVVGINYPRNPSQNVRPNSSPQGDRNSFDLNRGLAPANENVDRVQHYQFVATDERRSFQDGQQYTGSTQINNDVKHKYNQESLNKDIACNQGTCNNQKKPNESQLNSATNNQQRSENNQHYEGNNQKRPVEIEHKDKSQNKEPESKEFLNSDATYNQERPDQSTSQKFDAYNYQNASSTQVNSNDKHKKPLETTRRHQSSSNEYEKEQLWGEAEEDTTTENVIISYRSGFFASECPPGEHRINARCVSEDYDSTTNRSRR